MLEDGSDARPKLADAPVRPSRVAHAEPKQEALYAALPYKLKAEGTYHNLGLFFDRISKFPRIINVGDIIIKAKSAQEANATIDAECTATTFVLQENQAPAAGGRGGGRGVVPKQPSAK